MSISAFSVGRDTQLIVIGPSRQITLNHVTAFDSHQITQSVRVNRLDGSQMGMELPKGWEGGFELERGDSVLEDFIANVEQGYFNGSMNTLGSMYQYVSKSMVPHLPISTTL